MTADSVDGGCSMEGTIQSLVPWKTRRRLESCLFDLRVFYSDMLLELPLVADKLKPLLSLPRFG